MLLFFLFTSSLFRPFLLSSSEVFLFTSNAFSSFNLIIRRHWSLWIIIPAFVAGSVLDERRKLRAEWVCCQLKDRDRAAATNRQQKVWCCVWCIVTLVSDYIWNSSITVYFVCVRWIFTKSDHIPLRQGSNPDSCIEWNSFKLHECNQHVVWLGNY